MTLIKDKDVSVKMTLTTPNCPVAESLPKEVKDSIMEIKEVKKVDLDLVWEPPWDKLDVSAAKLNWIYDKTNYFTKRKRCKKN